MYHPRFSGKHYDMGLKFGNIIKKSNYTFPIELDGFQLDHGKKSGILLRQYFPEAVDEIKGITDALGVDNEIFTAWMMCMGCCMYNLDAEQNIEVRGCTVFSFEQNGEIFYGRNNDLPPFLKKASKSILYKPESGNNFILNTSSFINGEEGINNFGLTAAMTFVMPKLEEIRPGFNSVFIVRYLLEKCKNTEEGVRALHEIPIASSCNILLADTTGKMVVAECNPSKIHIRNPEINRNNRKFIISVNHFISEEMRKHDASSGNGEYLSAERYKTVYEALMNQESDNGIDLSRNILTGNYGFICQYKKELYFDTLWSSVFDLKKGEVFRAEGNPSHSNYVKDDRYMKFIKDAR